MAERNKIHLALVFLLIAGNGMALPSLMGNESSTKIPQASSNSDDPAMLSNTVSPPSLNGEFANASCRELFPDTDNLPAVHDQGAECANATAGNFTTSSNATTPGAAFSGGLGLYGLINSGMVSMETSDAVELIVNYCNLGLIIVGILLNGISVAVYLQPSMRSASSTYLAALCAVELLYLVFNSIIVFLNILLGSEATSMYTSLMIWLYCGIYANTVWRRLTFTLTFVVCSERLLAVSFPLKYKQLRLSSQPARVSVVCGVLVALVHLYLIFKLDVVPIGGGNYGFKERSFFVENETAMNTYANICRIIFVYLALVGTIVVNILTTLVMKRHRQNAKKLTTNRDTAKDDKAEKQITVTILVSSFIFVLFSLPSNINAIVTEYLPHYGFLKKEHYLYLTIVKLCTMLELLSSFLDYLSYMILSQRFRNAFMKMFCQRCRRNDAKAKATEDSSKQTQTAEFSSRALDPKQEGQ